ncbi:MAG: hypothetical protein J5599_09545 [Spirochaetales bacterium]|nr:hypothetical protein [Spirochaetales bacterium]
MKKFLLVLITIVTFLLPLSATYDPYATQQVSGFIDDVTYLYISPFKYENVQYQQYYGIDLDYSNTSNGHRFLIMPTDTQLTTPGLQIGTFKILATFVTSRRQANLVVTHGKLIHTVDSSVQLDYELAVQYAISDGESITRPAPTIGLSNTEMRISIATPIASVLEGNVYFRLANGVAATVAGQYTSSVTFTLEVL